jgi:itaconate CoA-transferase
MSRSQDLYRAKLTTAAEAVTAIPRTCNVVLGAFSAQPPALMQALAARVRAGAHDRIRLYYMGSSPAMGDTLLQYDLMAVIKPHPAFIWPLERALEAEGRKHNTQTVFYVPASFSAVPKLFSEYIHPDVVLLQVSPMDRGGYFSLGTTGAYSMAAARVCDRLIVEVNERMPRTFGEALLPVSEVHAIVEYLSALPEFTVPPGGTIDQQIGRYILELVPERACLQFGIGSVPNAVAAMLKDHHDLGVHTELLSDGIMSLIESGAVTNKYKRINRYKNVFNLAAGSQALYEALHDNPSMECYPAEYVNDPSIIGMNDHVLSVNAMLEVDLSGQVNAEFLHHHQYTAPGGQLDFVRGAAISRGGISIIAGHATADHGQSSRIVPQLEGPITDPRMDTQFIVTEYGVCDLRGKSTTERALGLIDIAHPDFRAELLAQAKALGYVS